MVQINKSKINGLRNQIFSCNECFEGRYCHHHQDLAGGYNKKIVVITINPSGEACKDKAKRINCDLSNAANNKNFEILKKYSDELIEAVIQCAQNGWSAEKISTSCSKLHQENINFEWWKRFLDNLGLTPEDLRNIAVLDWIKHTTSQEDGLIAECFENCDWWEKQLKLLPNLIGIIDTRMHWCHGMSFRRKIGNKEVDQIDTYAISRQTQWQWDNRKDEKEKIKKWIKDKITQ